MERINNDNVDRIMTQCVSHIKDGLRLVTPECTCGSPTCAEDAEVMLEIVACRVLEQYTSIIYKSQQVSKSELN